MPKLSELDPNDVSLVQTADPASQTLKLSDLDPDTVQMVQKAPGAAQSALDHFANAAAMGYLPQLSGALSKLTPDPDADVDAKMRAEGFTINQPDFNGYLSARDQMAGKLDQEYQAHPYASAAGSVGGAITGGAALSGITPAIDGATLASRAKQAAGIGAAYGAISNPGDNTGQINPVQPVDRLKNSAVGAVVGGTIQPVVEGTVGAFNWAKDKLSDYAAEKAAKAIGMTKADYKRMGPDQAKALGQAALDQGIVTPLSTPAKIEARTDAMKEAAGQQLGQVIDQSQAQLDQMPAKGMMPAGKPIQATPITRGMKVGVPDVQSFYPDTQSAAYSGAIDVPVSTVTPTVGPAGSSGDFLTPIQPRPAGSIDAQALAQKLSASGDSAQLSKVPGMEGLAGKINGFIDTLAKNPQDMNLRDAQSLRQGIDSAINWGKRVPEMAGTQQYLVNIRNALSGAMENSVDQASAASGGKLGALRQANQRYSTLAKINDIASNRAAMNAANRAVGLTDTIAGAGAGAAGATAGGFIAGAPGAVAGEVVGNTVGTAANKGIRTFGPSLAATGANNLSGVAGRFANVASAAGNNPSIAQSLIQTGLRQNPPASSWEQSPSTNPVLAQTQANRSPARGEDLWAQQGLSKLGIQDQDHAQQLLSNPRAKQLLIQASDLPPGSKALQRINDQIQKGYGKNK